MTITIIISKKETCHSHHVLAYPFPKRQGLDSSELKEFADDNNKFDDKVIQMGRKH